jgi:hypothetical protein
MDIFKAGYIHTNEWPGLSVGVSWGIKEKWEFYFRTEEVVVKKKLVEGQTKHGFLVCGQSYYITVCQRGIPVCPLLNWMWTCQTDRSVKRLDRKNGKADPLRIHVYPRHASQASAPGAKWRRGSAKPFFHRSVFLSLCTVLWHNDGMLPRHVWIKIHKELCLRTGLCS